MCRVKKGSCWESKQAKYHNIFLQGKGCLPATWKLVHHHFVGMHLVQQLHSCLPLSAALASAQAGIEADLQLRLKTRSPPKNFGMQARDPNLGTRPPGSE